MKDIEKVKYLLNEIKNGIRDFRAGTLTNKKKERVKKNIIELCKNPKMNKNKLIILIGLTTAWAGGIYSNDSINIYNGLLKQIEDDLLG